jgi:hypothetical protein
MKINEKNAAHTKKQPETIGTPLEHLNLKPILLRKLD